MAILTVYTKLLDEAKMDTIDRTKEYIHDAVISPLERLMNEDSGEPEVNLYEKYCLQGGYPPKDSVYKSLLHAMMMPYYGNVSKIWTFTRYSTS